MAEPKYDCDWSWAFQELRRGRAVQRPTVAGDFRRLEPTSREAPTIEDMTVETWGPGTGPPVQERT